VPKFNPKQQEQNVWDYLREFNNEFWSTHKVIKTEYNIRQSSYSDYDDYGCSFTVREKQLYGPYEDKSEAEEHVKLLNADPNLKPSRGELIIREHRLVESPRSEQFWV
jgi:hypothetical protein